ncbi:MAG: acyl carrier protein [Bacillota bacterium]|nr:acyl carrier protein [Bacillota bacterium]
MIFDTIKKIIIDKLNLSPDYEIEPETSLKDDLKADSVDAIEVIMELESEFGIEIDDKDLVKFETVADLEEYIENALNE